MRDYLIEILSRVRTVEERTEFLNQIEEVKQGLFLVGHKAEVFRKKLTPWLSNLPLKEVLHDLDEIIKWPVVGILVAMPVDNQGIELISVWLRKHVDPKALIDVRVDKANGIGPVFYFQGRIKDYSVKNKLEQYGF